MEGSCFKEEKVETRRMMQMNSEEKGKERRVEERRKAERAERWSDSGNGEVEVEETGNMGSPA